QARGTVRNRPSAHHRSHHFIDLACRVSTRTTSLGVTNGHGGGDSVDCDQRCDVLLARRNPHSAFFRDCRILARQLTSSLDGLDVLCPVAVGNPSGRQFTTLSISGHVHCYLSTRWAVGRFECEFFLANGSASTICAVSN